MTEITEYWPEADDEYEVLVSLLVPAAQARFDRTHDALASLAGALPVVLLRP